MIGTVMMDISKAEMQAAVQYYFNSDLFFSKHKVKVTSVRQRSSGRFVVDFEGQPEIKRAVQPEALEQQGGISK